MALLTGSMRLTQRWVNKIMFSDLSLILFGSHLTLYMDSFPSYVPRKLIIQS